MERKNEKEEIEKETQLDFIISLSNALKYLIATVVCLFVKEENLS